MKLFSRHHGEGEEALIILPGLLGSSANWQSIAKRMGRHRAVYTLDMRNHGQSPWSERMDYTSMAEDVAEFIQSLDQNRIHLMGHSMGGKAAMRLALDAPELIDSLIVADIGPVSYIHDFDGQLKPMLALNLDHVENRAQADLLLSNSVAEPSVRGFLLHNLAFNAEREQYYWRPNLPVLHKSMATVTGFELESEERFNKPALFIYGANSDYVEERVIAKIEEHFPQADLYKLENAGHWLHVERPHAFIQACENFLSAID